MKSQAILTFDLEFWYESISLKKYLHHQENLLDEEFNQLVLLILNELKKNNHQATFFTTGQVMRKCPELIRKIDQLGHEIALHGYSHKSLNKLNEDKLEKEISRSIHLLKKITKKHPLGFRAPNFSLNNQTNWAFKILEKFRIKYDSSIFPIKTPLYGLSNVPLIPYRIGKNSSIIEFPLAVFTKSFIKIPIAGGIYFRIIPFFIYQKLLKSVLKKRIAILYFHPYDLSTKKPKIKMPLFLKKIKYFGLKKSRKNFKKLLSKFDFISIKQYLNENLIN